MKKKQTADSAFLSLCVSIGVLVFCATIVLAIAQRTISRAPANIITVTNLNDSGIGSLRQALADANDGDTIDFAVNGTISLTNGELVIDKSVTITGKAQSITVSRALGRIGLSHFPRYA